MFRTAEGLKQLTLELRDLQARYANVRVNDRGKVFNTDLLEARELGYLLDCAEATVAGALARTESRGGALPRGLPRAQRHRLAQAHARLPCRGRP